MGREPNPLPRRANRRPLTLTSVGTGPVTQPLKRQDLASLLISAGIAVALILPIWSRSQIVKIVRVARFIK